MAIVLATRVTRPEPLKARGLLETGTVELPVDECAPSAQTGTEHEGFDGVEGLRSGSTVAATGKRRAKLGMKAKPTVAAGILLGGTAAYALSSGLVRSESENTMPGGQVPAFLLAGFDETRAANERLSTEHARQESVDSGASPMEPEPPSASAQLELISAEADARLAMAVGTIREPLPDASSGSNPNGFAEASAPSGASNPGRASGFRAKARSAARTMAGDKPTRIDGRLLRTSLESDPAQRGSDQSDSSLPARALAATEAAGAPTARDGTPEPDTGGSAKVNSLVTYTYAPSTLFQVYTAPMRVTDLMLQPGEDIDGEPATGDSARWVLSLGKAVVDGVPQQHLFIKPTLPGLVTNLTLTTNRRTYFVELNSYADGTYMAAVQWRYPEDEAERRRQAAAKAKRDRRNTTVVSDVNALNFDYTVTVARGEPTWTPTMVFDDGKKTFIRFPRRLAPAQAPGLFVIRQGSTQFVNYRVKNDLYVVEYMIREAELRIGTQDMASQEVVRITRK